MESYQRVQAVILVQDMIDKINANRKSAPCYASALTFGKDYTGTPAPTCSTGTGPGEMAQAVADLLAWDAMLKGSAEAAGGTSFGAMIDARGCLSELDAANKIYRVSVAWQGLVATAAPLDTCGKDLYGNDKLRRVVTMTVRIGKLS
jgi:type IV pilus assembly protein PilV